MGNGTYCLRLIDCIGTCQVLVIVRGIGRDSMNVKHYYLWTLIFVGMVGHGELALKQPSLPDPL